MKRATKLIASLSLISVLGAFDVRGADAPMCKVEPVNMPCRPPTAATRYSIDLGRYEGFFLLYDVTPFRIACLPGRRCLCEITDKAVPAGRYDLAFDGNGPRVPVDFDGKGKMTLQAPSYLGGLISSTGKRLVLSKQAVVPVRFERGEFRGVWGLEYWTCPQWSAQSLTLGLIRGQRNTIGAGNFSLQELTLAHDGKSITKPAYLDVVAQRPLTLRFNLVGQ